MILGLHFILSASGFWLPNDRRGSWSQFIRNYELHCFGPSTKVTTRASLASAQHDRESRREAKRCLRFAPVRFTGAQARSIANGFARAAAEAPYVVHALAILPDHAHLVIGWCATDVERIARHLKARATQQLTKDGLHPFMAEVKDGSRPPSPWARGSWRVFIDSSEQFRAVVEYVRRNPLKAGFREQRWRFVRPLEI